MKKRIQIAGLLLGLILTGCSSAMKDSTAVNDINIYEIAETSNQNYYFTHQDGKISSNDFNLGVDFNSKTMDISLENKSNRVIFLNWEDMEYIGLDGKTQKVFNLNEKDKGFYETSLPTALDPHETLTAKLVPLSNLRVLFGSGAKLQNIFIENNMFAKELKNQTQDYAQLILPVGIGKPEELVDISVYFGTKEDVENINIPKPSISLNKPKTYSSESEIGSENNLLRQELESKNRILDELKERERLQNELLKKEQEILELRKKLSSN